MRLGPATLPAWGPPTATPVPDPPPPPPAESLARLHYAAETSQAVECRWLMLQNTLCLGRMSLRLLSGSQASASKGTAPPSVPAVHFHCGTATSV